MSLKLGHALNASNLKEGDDVYFECQVKANPPPRRIIWKKEVSNMAELAKNVIRSELKKGSQIAKKNISKTSRHKNKNIVQR